MIFIYYRYHLRVYLRTLFVYILDTDDTVTVKLDEYSTYVLPYHE